MKKIIDKTISILLSLALLMSVFVPVAGADDLLSQGERLTYKGHTYIRVDASMTWQDAKAYCEANGGYLATVTSLAEKTVVERLLLNGQKDQYWLGATDEAQEGKWQWITGEGWTDFVPMSVFDNAYGVEDYLQIQRVNDEFEGDGIGTWNDAPNDNYLEKESDFYSLSHIGFIYEQGNPMDESDSGQSFTVNGLTATYAGHTYTLIEESLSWKDAVAACEAKGGYLATITTEKENEAIKALISNGSQKAVYWLGGTDEAEEGNWQWVTGERWSYTPDNCELDNSYGNEHYLQIQRKTIEGHTFGFWNDCNNLNSIKQLSYFYHSDNVGYILETGDSPIETKLKSAVTEVPIIYVKGRTNIYDANGKYLYVENTEDIPDLILDLKDDLMDAIRHNTWDAYREKLTQALDKKFSSYRLNQDGEIDNGSHNNFSWSYETIPSVQQDIFSYLFEYDMRRDPWDIAEDLHNYILCVKEKTGSAKIHLLSRCFGCNVVSAYLARYGYEDVLSNVFFASAAKGFDYESEMFAGKFDFDSDAISRYSESNLKTDNTYVTEFLKATISLCNDMGILNLSTDMGTLIFNRIKKEIVPTMLLNTFATCPGYWAMINDENYEDAKEFVFGDEMDTTYKKLVEKIDRYHYTVMNQLDNTLIQMKNKGISMYIVCKYGFQPSPFIKSSSKLGDNTVDLYSQSFGANCVEIGEKFNQIYLWKAKKHGTDIYISPDRQVDASTALFKDSTWFIKNCKHSPFYDCFNPLLQEMCYAENQLTVFDNAAFPQYLFYNEDNSTCIPLDDTNKTYNDIKTQSFFVYLYNYFRTLVDLIKHLLK